MSPAPWSAFFRLGVEHIFTGYDHLVFLLGLLAGGARRSTLLILLTCFTIGHSLTLALATADVIHVPPGIGEPLIAVTIIAVGLENLRPRARDSSQGTRVGLTVLFGLIHGFGFASVLRDLGIGRDGRGIAGPLLGFNLGVEVGQIVFASIVLPGLWWLRRQPRLAERGPAALSLLVIGAGLYWLVERLVNNFP